MLLALVLRVAAHLIATACLAATNLMVAAAKRLEVDTLSRGEAGQ